MDASGDDYDERSLIEAAQADPARFVDLYERHFHRVYAYVARRAASRAERRSITWLGSRTMRTWLRSAKRIDCRIHQVA